MGDAADLTIHWDEGLIDRLDYVSLGIDASSCTTILIDVIDLLVVQGFAPGVVAILRNVDGVWRLPAPFDGPLEVAGPEDESVPPAAEGVFGSLVVLRRYLVAESATTLPAAGSPPGSEAARPG